MVSPRRAWLLCTLLFCATALSFLDRQILSVLAPRITAEFAMSNTVYARVIFAFVLSYTIMFALGGRVLDALGTRLGLALAVGFWSIASILHAYTTGPWSLGAARLLLGIGEGPCFPAATKGAIEWSQTKQRALAVGFANGGSAFGAVLAPPLTVWSVAAFGWRGTFVIAGLLGFVWLVAWFFAFHGLPHIAPSATGTKHVSFRSLLARPEVRRLLAARFCFDPVFYFYMFWIPQYLALQRNMSLSTIGAYIWIPFLALGLTNIGAGRVSDYLVSLGWKPRRARMTLMLVAALITPASWFASLVDSAEIAIGLMAFLMVAHGLWIANYITLIGDTVAPEEVGTTVGLTGTCGGIAGMISSLAIGAIVDRFSFGPVFFVSALLYPLAWFILRTGKARTNSI
jgi:MFS transporter, ACS family, hexuronate transporter